ncbi:hypothetical protein XCV3454 [Xanthomonas euvesicatoria pv. vesicatoria str. 85-10]|uniref:Uncharacterized protein n=1 Tax=Xanthomonas euvesicatoria pv. vesicatoria (strain 85-10) TaxID=316273 RepID=Q3BPX8_XANE5|nr:hypothetical protein XCV3454 [Xanthomonas euvesicatoria pv. vesicatoria str. 85-10]
MCGPLRIRAARRTPGSHLLGTGLWPDLNARTLHPVGPTLQLPAPRQVAPQWRPLRPGNSPQVSESSTGSDRALPAVHGQDLALFHLQPMLAAEIKKADPGSRPGSAAKHARPLPRDPDAPAALCTASRNSDATALATLRRHRETHRQCDHLHRQLCAVHP